MKAARARALAQGDKAALREALAGADAPGARPLAERLRQRLHAAGARGVPRGGRSTTRAHPVGLTAKEVAVLGLLAAGLRNKEIAQRLSRSPRTIEHHLKASSLSSRSVRVHKAVSAALRLGFAAAA